MSTAIDTVNNLVTQFGVADSGDGLAILRLLGQEVNASMISALGKRVDDVAQRRQALEHRESLQLSDRLSPANQITVTPAQGGDADHVYWTAEEGASLRSDLTSEGYSLSSAAFVVQYTLETRETDAQGNTVVSTSSGLVDQAQFDQAMSGATVSTNSEGQTVLTKTVGDPDSVHVTFVVTDPRPLMQASAAEVAALKTRIDDDTQGMADTLDAATVGLHFTLQEWMNDAFTDERVFRNARAGDDRRAALQMDSAFEDLRRLTARLQQIERDRQMRAPTMNREPHHG